MRSGKQTDKRPPKIWDLPFGIRRKLSSRRGRQRTVTDDGHLLIVLYRVPESKFDLGEKVYFWRDRDHEWHYSERGGGFSRIEHLIQQYDDRVAELDEQLTKANDSQARFQVLDEATPVLRNARGLCDALQKALDLTEQQAADASSLRPSQPDSKQSSAPSRVGSTENPEASTSPSPLQSACDHAIEVVRAAEILKGDTESSIQFAQARQQEIQSHYVRQQSQAAHRLNILAATFLPVATISSVFGMNLVSGLEGKPALFWLMLLLATGVGAWIGYSVMNVRQLNPTDW